MRVQIEKWGNGAAVRIPESVMAAASSRIDQFVEVRAEGGRIVIEPVRAPSFTFDSLLEAMDPETFPEEADFGPPVGGEAW